MSLRILPKICICPSPGHFKHSCDAHSPFLTTNKMYLTYYLLISNGRRSCRCTARNCDSTDLMIECVVPRTQPTHTHSISDLISNSLTTHKSQVSRITAHPSWNILAPHNSRTQTHTIRQQPERKFIQSQMQKRTNDSFRFAHFTREPNVGQKDGEFLGKNFLFQNGRWWKNQPTTTTTTNNKKCIPRKI